jgi:hypothetical protein
MVCDVSENLAADIKEAGAEIEVSDIVLEADTEQLRTLLQNLIHNAVAYRRPGIRPRILVTAVAVPDGVTVRVTDNGKGIPAKNGATSPNRWRVYIATTTRPVPVWGWQRASGSRRPMADGSASVRVPTAEPPCPSSSPGPPRRNLPADWAR